MRVFCFYCLQIMLLSLLSLSQSACYSDVSNTDSSKASSAGTASSPTTKVGLPLGTSGQLVPSLAPMLEKATPAVVNISTATLVPERSNPLLNDPFFRFFFGVPDSNRPREEKRNQSLGSGVVIDAKKGYVVTNNHVIDKADKITVTLRDGREFKAELVGKDAETDVALLKIPAENLMAIPLADSDRLQVGDFVVAVGNPFGLGQTVTLGIISALGRSGLGIEGYEDFIQTDASINPGNSGGALVNLLGELVGINTAIIAPSGGNVGIGFAIPVNMANQVIQHLIQYGELRRGILGISIQDLKPDLAKAFGLKEAKGAVVNEVQRNSPAEKAGLKTGDVITAINNVSVSNAAAARNRIGLLRVGETVKLALLRGGQPMQIEAVIGDSNSVSGGKISEYLEGLTLEDSAEGITVREVSRESIGWQVGFRSGDIILGFNRRPVQKVSDLKRFMSRYSPPFLIQINRDNQILSILLR